MFRKGLLTALMTAVLLAGFGSGCSGETGKGTNKDKDRQTPPARGG